jgi:hypothetical protein
MKRIKIFTLLSLIFLIAACSGNSNIYIDRVKKAIVSRNGDPFKKVIIDGAGVEVTYQVYDASKDNSAIYFNKHNPGFMVSEGLGLNKDYFLKLKPSTKYIVTAYAGDTQAQIVFRTDFNGDLKEPDDD